MVFNRENPAISDVGPEDLRKADVSDVGDTRPSGKYPSAPANEKPTFPTYPLQFTEDGKPDRDDSTFDFPRTESSDAGVMRMTVEEMQDMLAMRIAERTKEVTADKPSKPKGGASGSESQDLREDDDGDFIEVGNGVDRESSVIRLMEQKRRALDAEAREMVPTRGLGEVRGKALAQLENKIELAKGYLEAQYEIGNPERIDDAVLDLARVEDALERLDYLKSCSSRALPETSGQVETNDPQGHILPDTVVDGLLEELDANVKALMRDVAKYYDPRGKSQS